MERHFIEYPISIHINIFYEEKHLDISYIEDYEKHFKILIEEKNKKYDTLCRSDRMLVLSFFEKFKLYILWEWACCQISDLKTHPQSSKYEREGEGKNAPNFKNFHEHQGPN